MCAHVCVCVYLCVCVCVCVCVLAQQCTGTRPPHSKRAVPLHGRNINDKKRLETIRHLAHFCVCVHVRVCVCLCVCVCVCMLTCAHRHGAPMAANTHSHPTYFLIASVFRHANIYLCVCVCVFVCVHLCTQAWGPHGCQRAQSPYILPDC
jgi:hypothetical protein